LHHKKMSRMERQAHSAFACRGISATSLSGPGKVVEMLRQADARWA
jgi:hypothetical protein